MDNDWKHYSSISIDNFHLGQKIALEDKNYSKSLEYFKKSLGAAEQIQTSDKDYEDWRIYIRGTIAYFKKDSTGLQQMLEKVTNPKNKAVLTRLLSGLQKRGEISYKKDYLD